MPSFLESPVSQNPRSEERCPPLRRAVWALAAVGLALRLAFALLPLSVHLLVLEDDAWMVVAIARNFALGHGISADGVTPTNGFQPLYPLTLGALPYLIAPNALDVGFSANLIICALLNTLALWPLWWLARRFGGEVGGLLAVALFALNPFLIRVSVNGMETSLGLLLLLLLFMAFYRLDLRRASHVLALALLTALATLARLDASLAFAAIVITMSLWAWRRTTNDQRPTTNDRPMTTDDKETRRQGDKETRRQGDSKTEQSAIYNLQSAISQSNGQRTTGNGQRTLVVLYIAATLVFLAPYFAFNYAVSGTLGPSSGAALAYMHSFGPGPRPGDSGDFNLTNGLSALFQTSAVNLEWVPTVWLKLLLVCALAALLALALGRRLVVALPLLLYLLVPPLYYGYMLQQARERYFVGLSAVLIVLLAWLGAELWRRRPQRAVAIGLAGVVAAVVALNSGEAIRFYQGKLAEPDQTQPISYQAALWIRDHLPPDALIGAKNSGIYQYYSGHVALNIDGKLNHEILPAMQRRELLDYLRARGVQYLVDREETMADHIMFYSRQFGPAPYHRAPTPIERLAIYGKILTNALGARLPLNLDARDAFTPTRPFSDAAEIVQRFARPNDADNPVVIYRLKPTSAAGVP
jgi:hypothetical protein